MLPNISLAPPFCLIVTVHVSSLCFVESVLTIAHYVDLHRFSIIFGFLSVFSPSSHWIILDPDTDQTHGMRIRYVVEIHN